MTKKNESEANHDKLLEKLDHFIEVMQKREESTHELITRVDKVFSLFEEASKHVDEVQSAETRINTLSTKLESLLEQNKAIAQGLILLEKYVRGKTRLEPTAPSASKPLEFGSP